MSIYRIGETQARAEQAEALRNFLLSIISDIRSSQGCESVHLYQNQDDPSKFLMIEAWDRVESHRASVREIPTEKLGQIRPLLAASPSGSYFHLIHQE